MRPRTAIVAALILWASCNKPQSGDIEALIGGLGASTSVVAAGNNFSADLAKDLGVSGGNAAVVGAAVKPTDAKPGASDPKPADARPGPSDPKAVAKLDAKPDAKDAKLAKPDAKLDAKPDAKDAKLAKTTKAEPPEPSPNDSQTEAEAAITKPIATKPEIAMPVKIPADLASIKMSLLPNWDRDISAPGTFQYVVRIKGTQSTKTFTFHYGYDDPKAPLDHALYKKYLIDNKLMSGEIKDRQRGGAWFLEGADGTGRPSFRYVILYSGRQLICHGSLYRDADSAQLGDDRDQTVIQAKQICETLAL